LSEKISHLMLMAENILHYLLSPENLQFIISKINQIFRIGRASENKCLQIIQTYFKKYISESPYEPETNEELIMIIDEFNKRCLEDFSCYLQKKYPNMNIYRDREIQKDTYLVKRKEEIPIMDEPVQQHTAEPVEEIQIISYEEKERLLKKHGFCNNLIQTPIFLQTLKFFMSQKNTSPYDQLLTKEELLQYLQQKDLLKLDTNGESVVDNGSLNGESQHSVTDLLANMTANLEAFTAEKNGNDLDRILKMKTTDENIKSKKDLQQVQKASQHQKKRDKELKNIDLIINVDLEKIDKKIFLEQLLEKINKLHVYKEEYLQEDNTFMVKTIEEKIEEIKKIVLKIQEKFTHDIVESREKLEKIQIETKEETLEDNKKGDILNLQINPEVEESEINDLKNITIGIKEERKIKEINLISYFVPLEKNNIHPFNNKFSVYENEKIHTIRISPGYYDIHNLLKYIMAELTFLTLEVVDEKVVIRNKNEEVTFDLMISEDGVWKILGFTKSCYKNESIYFASQKPVMDSHQQVSLIFSGISMEPYLLEFEKEKIVKKCLKKSSGLSYKKLTVKFLDSLEQDYHFPAPFKLSLHILYV